MLRKFLFIAFTVFVSLATASSTFAQSTGSIRGTVTEQTGAAIAGATVIATDTNTGLTRTVASNENGILEFRYEATYR
jgi:Carboxypeptidase regulatory-like domain